MGKYVDLARQRTTPLQIPLGEGGTGAPGRCYSRRMEQICGTTERQSPLLQRARRLET